MRVKHLTSAGLVRKRAKCAAYIALTIKGLLGYDRCVFRAWAARSCLFSRTHHQEQPKMCIKKKAKNQPEKKKSPIKTIYLSCSCILHFKCNFRRRIWGLFHLPNTCLEPIPRHDGCGKTYTKISQRRGHASTNSLKDCASGKSKR